MIYKIIPSFIDNESIEFIELKNKKNGLLLFDPILRISNLIIFLFRENYR